MDKYTTIILLYIAYNRVKVNREIFMNKRQKKKRKKENNELDEFVRHAYLAPIRRSLVQNSDSQSPPHEMLEKILRRISSVNLNK